MIFRSDGLINKSACISNGRNGFSTFVSCSIRRVSLSVFAFLLLVSSNFSDVGAFQQLHRKLLQFLVLCSQCLLQACLFVHWYFLKVQLLFILTFLFCIFSTISWSTASISLVIWLSLFSGLFVWKHKQHVRHIGFLHSGPLQKKLS